jgi:hypothetical protein
MAAWRRSNDDRSSHNQVKEICHAVVCTKRRGKFISGESSFAETHHLADTGDGRTLEAGFLKRSDGNVQCEQTLQVDIGRC